ncbi:pimeloyl-ACP methyl ester carboxylesterase [Saccharothrix tamanrassetensis]|uniref:Pimeloyl-ACP methyl ester carboxylesterase n=1 Tax=Saccharothrix tamanrassetensis TaxID=1051531 RepID=A0A841CTU7_9PSEU|nr:alpha/beta hydrolase [Saccharothrix tamanrassetensis]MBB5959375.1 pimeloyl-ACP methyl ester carboxylesterase [Saccharothrix tamanrassetensis]
MSTQPTSTTSTATVGTLRVDDASLHYEVRGHGPLVVLAAAPMDARSFEPLADLLATDHTVLTTDPRGIHRSPVDDLERDSTPERRADDLYRLITHLDAGPAAVLGSSGGAVSVLALAQAHPEVAHTVIAHEPPLNELLDDREELRERTEEIITTYRSGDPVGAFRKFLEMANIQLPEEVLQHMAGGERDPQSIADDDYQYTRMLRATTRWVPDLEKLRSSASRILVGIGEESTGQLCDRTSRALAAGLGTEPTMFPGDHVGFAHDPEAFATRLRIVLKG